MICYIYIILYRFKFMEEDSNFEPELQITDSYLDLGSVGMNTEGMETLEEQLRIADREIEEEQKIQEKLKRDLISGGTIGKF